MQYKINQESLHAATVEHCKHPIVDGEGKVGAIEVQVSIHHHLQKIRRQEALPRQKELQFAPSQYSPSFTH